MNLLKEPIKMLLDLCLLRDTNNGLKIQILWMHIEILQFKTQLEDQYLNKKVITFQIIFRLLSNNLIIVVQGKNCLNILKLS